ncbi:MAG: LLM class F420-dependent oxidoreductase [Candidatus Binatia bacterium]|nr:LLM class F420-dependent oxidoreductase [Candidatus Binatia bacterium]
MKLGLFLPMIGEAEKLRDLLITGATTAEKVGFHSLWFPEHVVLVDEARSRYPYSADGSLGLGVQAGMLEPFAAIATAAAVTERIRLGTGICLVPQRSPIYTAKQVADCDVLSGGRIDFGVGIGWLREEFDALGADFDERAHLCREYLAAMNSLWTDEVSQHQGNLLVIPPVRMYPKPIQKPHPPIIFGGESMNALRRVADLGQGWFGFHLDPKEAAERVHVLNGVLSQRGRRPDSIEVSVSPYLKPNRDAESLEAYAAAGVDQVILMAFASEVDALRDEIEQLAGNLMDTATRLQTTPRPHH